jgi:hypothetical protein
MPLYHDCRPLPGKSLFNDDFLLSDFAESILKGWANSIPAEEPVTREQFNAWKEKFIHALETAADSQFRQYETVVHNLEVEKRENLF